MQPPEAARIATVDLVLLCAQPTTYYSKLFLFSVIERMADFRQMRATGDKLEDKYIIPIARELAIALKAIHEEGIIHRDVKGKLSGQRQSQSR